MKSEESTGTGNYFASLYLSLFLQKILCFPSHSRSRSQSQVMYIMEKLNHVSLSWIILSPLFLFFLYFLYRLIQDTQHTQAQPYKLTNSGENWRKRKTVFHEIHNIFFKGLKVEGETKILDCQSSDSDLEFFRPYVKLRKIS